LRTGPWLGLALALAIGTEARANGRDPIALARVHYGAQRYVEAIQALQSGLAREHAMSTSARVDAYEILGLANLVLGHENRAREAFRRLLALSPSHRLREPSGSPKLFRFFEAVRSGPPAPLRFEGLSVAGLVAGKTALFTVRLKRAPAAARVWVHYRARGQAGWQRLQLVGGPVRYRAALTAPGAPRGAVLQFYFEAIDHTDGRLGGLGSADSPLERSVQPAPEATSGQALYRRWWFWSAIGAALVTGATVGIVLGTRSTPEGNLPPGRIQLPLGVR
jgi:tetratricopeptide (TPR) repeat protein